jgi:hypothetical protein
VRDQPHSPSEESQRLRDGRDGSRLPLLGHRRATLEWRARRSSAVAFRKGRLEGEVPERVARYTSSLEEDAEISEEVLLVNAAHLRSLNRMGFLDDDALRRAMEALRSFPRDALRSADPRLEDVHTVVEEHLKAAVPEAGENLALGKSRNDAVSTAIRMRLRRYMVEIVLSGSMLAEALISKAEENAATLFPLFTHEQPAQEGKARGRGAGKGGEVHFVAGGGRGDLGGGAPGQRGPPEVPEPHGLPR